MPARDRLFPPPWRVFYWLQYVKKPSRLARSRSSANGANPEPFDDLQLADQQSTVALGHNHGDYEKAALRVLAGLVDVAEEAFPGHGKTR